MNLLIAGSFAFPFGTGEAGRVRLLSLALKENGVNVKALNLICTETCNIDAKGTYRDIDFEHATGTISHPRFFICRYFIKVKGLCVGLFRMASIHFKQPLDCVLLYGSCFMVTVPIIVLCRLLGIPVIFEVSEWWPIMPRYPVIEKEIFVRFVLRNIDGFIVISENISKAIADLHRNIKRKIPVLKVPILVDPVEWQVAGDKKTAAVSEEKYMLWCGDIIGYIEEVKFLIKAMLELFTAGAHIKLRLVGKAPPKKIEEIRDYQHSLGLPLDCVEFTGSISQEELVRQYAAVFALLLPMRDNKQNFFRFPNKLGEYLASGRPVVISSIGEIPNFLNNGVDAILCKAGDTKDFANGVEILLKSPEHAQKIGEAGRKLCATTINYRIHGARILDFIFNEVYKKYRY